MTQQKLDNQRDVVKNERRQSVDNVPYGQAEEVLLEALYPAGPSLSPQRHRLDGRPVGRPARPTWRRFSGRITSPITRSFASRATFSRRRRKQWIEKYFGPLSRGPEVKPPKRSVPSLSAAETHPIDRRGEPAPRPVDLADRAGQPSRRAGARRAGGRPGGLAQGKPPVPCPHVRPAARGRGRCVASHPVARGYVRGRALCPARRKARRAGQDRRRRDRAAEEGRPHRPRGQEGPERAGKRLDHGAPVGDAQGQRSQPVDGDATAIRSVIGPSSRRSSR